jgi:hypothetical protein
MSGDPCLSSIRDRGVIAADELSYMKTPGAYIINTDPSYRSGQHWIAVYIPEGGVNAEVFDPLGEHPFNYPFMREYWNRRKNFTFNTKRWQPSGTSTCGQICLFFLYHRCRGWTLNDITGFYWNSDLKVTNNLVVRFVERYFCIPCMCTPKKYQCAQTCL